MNRAAFWWMGLLVCFCQSVAAWGMGEEQLGNDPLDGANYTAHAGVMEVINDPHRVYRWWVNGNEQFFFRGDSVNVNEALQAFARLKSTPREVLLRPAPGHTSTFQRDKEIPFNWKLQIVDGIAGHMRTKDQGSKLWPAHPVLTIYVGGPVQLSELVIPEGVDVLTLRDLKQRYLHGLHSKDQDVRGWTCGMLAELDPYDGDVLQAIEAMLEDASQWVRSNAVGSIGTFGARAATTKPSLEKASREGDERLQKRVAEIIDKVEQASEDAAAVRRHQQALQAIQAFQDRRHSSPR